VIFIVCDTGEHYLTKFHSDEWMKEKLLLEPQRITAGLIAETKNGTSPQAIIAVAPTNTVGEALAKMNENGVTQLPVIEEHQSVGSLRESRVLAKLLADRDLINAPVSDVMDESFPVVEMDTSVTIIRSKLQSSPAVLIEDFKRVTGIITRSDVLDLPD
ncbi:MAG: CBS domain-containing protein, partial [Acidobacteria bacterium]|nr:CBS domain-containing protein [Acidobacteriota bacterium]